MNGVHDQGGMHGFGPIDPEPEQLEPIFHAEWEKRALALNLACGALGRWNIDASRHSRERLDPVDYLSCSYYAKWIKGLESLLVETGMLTEEELRTGQADGPAPAQMTDRRLAADRVGAAMAAVRPYDMDPTAPPRYQPGDRVRVRDIHTPGHTRAVRYARGHTGTIRTHHGCHVFPDANAHGDRVGEHLYGVAFDAGELWGGETNEYELHDGDTVHIDLWEPYLAPVPGTTAT
jgi:nitrile hydratase